MDSTQNGLYNFKQYDHYKIKILNDLVHITLLYTKIYVLNEIHKKHKHYISTQNKIKSQQVNLFQKCSEINKVLLTQYENSVHKLFKLLLISVIGLSIIALSSGLQIILHK